MSREYLLEPMGGGGKRRIASRAVLLAIPVVLVLAALSSGVPVGQTFPRLVTAASVAGTYFDYVLVIVMENHAICDILTYCGGVAPYATQLANASGLATNYGACGSSLADYLCLTGASTFGCTSNANPNSDNCTRLAWTSPNIVDRLVDADLTWKAYLENMTADCHSPPGGGYALRHNPFAYYGDIVTNATRCARVVPAGADDGALLQDLSSTSAASNYMWLTPNLCNDMDDCPIAVGDAYLSTLVPKILESTVFTTQRAALFITFDSPSGGNGAPDVYTLWAGPVAKVGYTSSVAYSHFSLLSTLEANWNLPPLNANDSGAANMTEFFLGATPGFSLSASPWSVSFLEGGSAASMISLHGTLGFTGSVALSATSTPSGITTTCSPSTIQDGESSMCTLSGSVAGSYTITVSGTNGTRVNSVTIEVQVVALLSASFTFSPEKAFVGRPVGFNGWATGGIGPYDYSWTFGDDTTASEPRVTHTFSAEGVFRVVLTVNDSSRQTADRIQDVSVARPAPQVATGMATNVEEIRATLNGNVQSLGEASNVDVGFLYGTVPTLAGATNWTAVQATGLTPFSAVVTDLAANTTYYFEAWANGHGFASGEIATFVTTAPPPSPVPLPSATLHLQGTLGRNGWFVSDVTITLTSWASEGFAARANIAIDGNDLVRYAAPFTLHDGRHTLVYYAFLDPDGLAEPHRYANLSVDTTPPELAIQDSPDIVTTSTFTFSWSGSDGGSGVESYEVRVDGEPYRTVGLAVVLTLSLPDGVHTLTVRVTDVAGNERTETKALAIDTNPFSPSGPYGGLPLYLLLLAVPIAITLVLLWRRRNQREDEKKAVGAK